VKRILKKWITGKAIITVLLLIYGLYIYFSGGRPVNDEDELFVIELVFYTGSSFLLIYFFLHMYDAMKFVMVFDFIFLIFIAYYFRINYIILFLDLITIFLIIFDHNDIKNFTKRKLRKINIHLKRVVNR
jgi:glycerol-3-phosphate acyltransferase PlsY